MTGNMIGENGDAAPALALLEQLPAGSKVLFLPGSGDPSPLCNDGARLPFALCGLGAGAH